MINQIIKDNAYWEKLYASKTSTYVAPERNFKIHDTQMVDQNGTHVTLYTEYGKYIVAYRMKMSETFWEKREYTDETEANSVYKSLVESELSNL